MILRPSTRRRFLKCLAGSAAAAAAGFAGAQDEEAPAGWRPDPLAFLHDDLDVLPRERWTCIEPRTDLLTPCRGFDRVTVHHSGSFADAGAGLEANGALIEGIMAGHCGRGYGDIGYHFILDPAGRVWSGRSLAYEGAHVYGSNVGNLGVMLLGNFEDDRPARPQLSALHSLVPLLCREFAVSPARVYGHCDLGASACPGRHLYGHVTHLRDAVAAT